jgi:hypothetical protein
MLPPDRMKSSAIRSEDRGKRFKGIRQHNLGTLRPKQIGQTFYVGPELLAARAAPRRFKQANPNTRSLESAVQLTVTGTDHHCFAQILVVQSYQ